MNTAILDPESLTNDTEIDPKVDAAIDIVPLVAFDLYRDVHKAIRNEMFAITVQAGSVDPDDLAARRAHATRVHDLVDLLVHHAEHEDDNIDPVLGRVDPSLVAEISAAHQALESRLQRIAELADRALFGDGRTGSHALYLELAAFTASYLQHQDFEERIVMRSLDAHLVLEELLDLHVQILSSVDPDVLMRFLSLMLPAINIVDRTEMLGGMQATAPAEAFAATWELAGNVLSTSEYLRTANRLGLPVDPAKVK